MNRAPLQILPRQLAQIQASQIPSNMARALEIAAQLRLKYPARPAQKGAA